MDGGQLEPACLPDPLAEASTVLKAQQVQEILARRARGESVSRIAQALVVDRKTVRTWLQRGRWQPRQRRPRTSKLDPFAAWLRGRAPEVGYNCAVLLRELQEQGYAGGLAQLHRLVRPLRLAARQQATVRFETAPGQQAQVDFGQRKLWIGEQYVVAHLFVFTLGYSRRCYVTAFPHERLDAVLAGHEQAFQHFGGVPLQIVVDNARYRPCGEDQALGARMATLAELKPRWGYRPLHWLLVREGWRVNRKRVQRVYRAGGTMPRGLITVH